MLEFLKEIYASVKSNANERVRNYYVGAFLFSWVTVNWQFVLTMLFSESKIEERITKASTYLSTDKTIIIPLTVSTCICLLLPVINMIIAYAQKKPNDYLRGDSHQIKANRLRAEIETETLRAERDSAYRKKSTSESLEVQTLQAQIQESKDISSKLSEENEALTQQLSVEMDNLLSTKSDLEAVQSHLYAVQTDFENMRSEYNKLAEQLEKSDKDYNLLEKQLDEAENKIVEIERSRDKSVEENVNLQRQVNQLKSQYQLNHVAYDKDNPHNNQEKTTQLKQVNNDTNDMYLTNFTSRDKIENPTVKAIRDALENPWNKAVKDITENPSSKAVRDLVESATVKAIRDAVGSPSAKTIINAANSPTKPDI